jgi:hypothetical protein
VKRFGRAIAAALMAASVCGTVGSCTGGGDRPAAPATTRPSTSAGCPAPAGGAVDSASVLVAGPVNGVPPSDARGERLTIVATVLDPACAPAAGANVRVWHTDAAGKYGPTGTDRCCYYGGVVVADANGRFRLDTIRPAQYPQPDAPPAHIHLEVQHSSGRLETEIVFTDESDAAAPVRPSRQVPVVLTRDAATTGGSWYGEAAFVVEP